MPSDAAIRDAERKQRDIDREIARLEADRAAKPPSKLEVRIDLAADAPTRATLKVTYAVRHAHWIPLYDARLDTGTKDREPSLELVRRADIVQTTGEDWSNVALAVSTVRMARGGSAPDLNSLIVQYPPSLPQQSSGLADMAKPRAMTAPAPAAADINAKRAEERQASVEASAFQVTFRIPGRVSVGANEGAKSLRISTATIAPDLAIRSAPVLDPTAFLEASFVESEDAPLLPGRVAIYRDGMFTGSGGMAAVPSDLEEAVVEASEECPGECIFIEKS